MNGYSEKGYELSGFNPEKPVIMFMGGSLGSKSINEFVRENIDILTQEFQIIHLCGKDNIDGSLTQNDNYIQFEFVKDELAHFINISDIVIGRSGSNAIYELLLNLKPMILIPLPLTQSRGDQLENAQYFAEMGYAKVIQEDDLTLQNFNSAVNDINETRHDIIMNMKQYKGGFKPDTLVSKLLNEEEV